MGKYLGYALALLFAVTGLASGQGRGIKVGVSSRAGGDIDVRGYHALLIAVETYSDPQIKPLHKPVADALALQRVLVSDYRFEPSNVAVLRNPGRDAIVEALDSLANVLGPDDNLLIFFAGHGVWDAQRKAGFWLPADAARDRRARWIPNSAVQLSLSGIRARHILLVADACFSGAILLEDQRTPFVDERKGYEKLDRLPSRKAMTSGAMTTVPDESVFLSYLIKRLHENAEPMITADELFSSLQVAVSSNSPSDQVPLFAPIKGVGHEGGDFVFVRRAQVRVAGAPSAPPRLRYDIPALQARVQTVRFFGSDSSMPVREQRAYVTRFDSATTKFIDAELDISFASPLAQAVEVPVSCSFVRPDGSVRGVARDTIRPEVGWTGVYHATGWGNTRAGTWSPGTYRLTCQTETETFATATFDVVSSVPSTAYAIPSIGAKLVDVRFWEEGPGPTTPVGERTYARRFSAARARYIGAELRFEHPAPGRPVSVAITCVRYRPDGTVSVTQDGNFEPQPDWRESTYSPGAVGWAAAGNYVPGTHRLECSAEGHVIATRTFEIERGEAPASEAPASELPTISALNARVLGLAFWQEGAGYLPAEQRQYANRFPMTAGYVGVGLRLERAPTEAVSVVVTCARTNPAGVQDREKTNTITVRASVATASEFVTYLAGHTPGTYRVDCRAEGKLIASGSYEITRP